jgi:hypothetical protein
VAKAGRVRLCRDARRQLVRNAVGRLQGAGGEGVDTLRTIAIDDRVRAAVAPAQNFRFLYHLRNFHAGFSARSASILPRATQQRQRQSVYPRQ